MKSSSHTFTLATSTGVSRSVRALVTPPFVMIVIIVIIKHLPGGGGDGGMIDMQNENGGFDGGRGENGESQRVMASCKPPDEELQFQNRGTRAAAVE